MPLGTSYFNTNKIRQLDADTEAYIFRSVILCQFNKRHKLFIVQPIDHCDEEQFMCNRYLEHLNINGKLYKINNEYFLTFVGGFTYFEKGQFGEIYAALENYSPEKGWVSSLLG